jgi:hypothetical protein
VSNADAAGNVMTQAALPYLEDAFSLDCLRQSENLPAAGLGNARSFHLISFGLSKPLPPG